MKTMLNILGGVAIVITASTVIYLDKKINELDNAVFQHMKDEHNRILMQNPCHAEGDESDDPDKDVHIN